ncbi:MAG: RNA methyltransferase [Lachnospiraceae bacterium]|nr:RNA methyltransferase [Lachnospiraceae bacterium]MCR5266924.1 RNA methyltransferase [Lachnospiraceae bacterium]
MITSLTNQKIKNVTALLTSTRQRREQNAYVIEGVKAFMEAPADKIRQVFLTQEGYEKIRQKRPEIASLVTDGTMQNLKGPVCELVSDEVFARMSDTKTPQGVLCVMSMPDWSVETLLNKKEDLLVLVLEGIQDPGNLGTMVRSAEAAGAAFILADLQTADLYSPKVIRATMGAIFRVPVVYTEDLKKALRRLNSYGVQLCAAHLRGRQDYWDMQYSRKTAFLIGNEGNGLSDDITGLSDRLVRIPMDGEVESLNASVAASLLLYEWKRQRS